MAFIQDKAEQNFFGGGIIFPFVLENGNLPIYSGPKEIKASIKALISWSDKRRFFLGEYFCNIEKTLEEPNDEITANLLQIHISEIITTFEKRVIMAPLQIVKISSDAIHIRIEYQIKNTQTIDSFIFPFYRNLLY